MPQLVTYGIIGCGMMGQEHLRNIALLPDARVGAIFEPDPTMRAAAQAIAPNALMVGGIGELLAVPALDCVLIASPNDLHVQQIQEVAARRALPLMVEKPVFTDPKDAARVRSLAYPAPLWVAMEYRYMPPIRALIDSVDAATGGPLMLTIREHRFPFLPKVGDWNRFSARSGGTLVEKCCHFFDLMRLLLRAEPVRVMASAGQAVNHKDERIDGRVPDVWDHGYVIVDFDTGARAMLELCMFAEGSRYQEDISVIGPRGRIEAFVPGPTRFWPGHLGAPPVPRVVVSPRAPKGPQDVAVLVDPVLLDAGDHNGSTYYQHERFVRVVRGEGRIEVGLLDGIRAVEMGQAAQRSAETGQAVTL
ncbi:Oxidoreductase family, NAD-binding Rossmann fold protein [Oceaniovalibus guishaninsula JLT2003]|uniref:Oxidoreductase family, NAD-binding Rossmann fold protein n=1 Tax=Oceaniovalibus guishaninsula JLT2003 TaxID=1231392 RepID=K2GTB4_9RHOB|nr:Gfo/Idh/MocA family oxidoreductase [Oceaniovalibus guishaninsula]EKE45796.1 Oxidoreductase family, NAD-binding Rossmann fold protein [Oceaniovalibus guishaninsula JLT2003]